MDAQLREEMRQHEKCAVCWHERIVHNDDLQMCIAARPAGLVLR